MNKKQRNSGLKTFISDNSPLALMIVIPLSLALCLLQYLIKSQSMLFLIIGSILSGMPLLIFGLKAMGYKELRNFTALAMVLLGVALLIWSGILVFKPTSQLAIKTQLLFETRSKAVYAEEITVSLEISPTTYYGGEKGLINIQVENNSEYVLILDSFMFETRNKFFDGFVVNYESAVPPISEKKEKLGISTALFFGEDQIIVPPGETTQAHVEIVANTPGDYTGEFYAVLLVGMNSKAMPRKIPEVTEDIFLVILSTN